MPSVSGNILAGEDMLHIILMILKILGILILSILGLAVCVGLLVLFCPIRYRLEGSLFGKPEGSIRISWLFRLISVFFVYKEKQAEFRICILGIRLKKREKKEKDKRSRKERAGKSKKKEKKAKASNKQQNSQKTAGNSTISGREQTEKEAADFNVQKEVLQEEKKKSLKHTDSTDIQSDAKKKEQKQEPAGEGLFEEETAEKAEKIKWLQIPKQILQKIKELLSSLQAGIRRFLALLQNLQQKKQAAAAFIRDEENRAAFRYTRGRLYKLLCHILPGKVTLKLHYGAEDPAVTGMVTGMIYMLYPKSAEKFQLTPDFEKRVLEGEIDIKGRVQIFQLLWTVFLIYRHKECNRIIKMILKR